MELLEVRGLADRVREQIHRVIVGQDRALDLLLTALLAEGHILFEGLPGTAKTLTVRVFAKTMDLAFKRIQFTPDLMPGDVTGTNLFDFRTNEFHLTKGPIFTDVLLADEINRTPPKTQAALLEAMQERSVTIDGVTHSLGSGFFVVATQNPIEHEGTYPLPEAQLDRFLFKVRIAIPDRDIEIEIVRRHGHRSSSPKLDDFDLRPVVNRDELQAARALVAQLHLSDEIVGYIVDLVRATREHPSVAYGGSPRAANMIATASRAHAALAGRDYVLPDDVQTLVLPTLLHRLVLAPSAEIEGLTLEGVLEEIVERVPVPR
ncbi:MAG: MoxR family ATPase [Planctomycetota bacterium]